MTVLLLLQVVVGGLDPALASILDTVSQDKNISVIAVMGQGLEIVEDEIEGLMKEERRDYVVRALRRFSEMTQGEVFRVLEGYDARSLWIANVVAFSAPRNVIIEIAQLSEVETVYPDRRRRWILTDVIGEQSRPCVADALSVPSDTAWGLKKIRAPLVWDMGYTGQGVVVAILDTGIDYNHPDLAGRMWNNPGEIPGNGVDDDGNGYVDDVMGYDFADNDSDPMDEGSNSNPFNPCHGTHVAGTVAGDGTEGTITGVAPGALLMACRVLSGVSGTISDILEAMGYAVANGAHVINMSIGFMDETGVAPERALMRTAAHATLLAGVIIAAAAGNGNPAGGHFQSPYNIASPGDSPSPWSRDGGQSAVVTSGATDSDDVRGNFSSFGPTAWNVLPFTDYPYPPGLLKPDVAAPGVVVLSTIKGGGYDDHLRFWGIPIAPWSGTSMSSPHTAGAFALMLSKNLELSPRELDSIIQLTSVELGPSGKDSLYGSGRIDVYEAVTSVIGIEEKEWAPISFEIFPNLITTTASIRFVLENPLSFSVRVYDILGRMVEMIKEGKVKEGNFVWSPENLPPGIYFVSLDVQRDRKTKKIVILR